MSTLVLVTDSLELRERFHALTGEHAAAVPAHPLPATPSQLFHQLDHGAAIPRVIVLHTDAQTAPDALALAERLHSECPGIAVVLVTDQPEAIGLAALRAGVSDLVHPECNDDDLRRSLDRALQAARSHNPDIATEQHATGRPVGTGRVISVVSPKGGVGKTTIATNVAVGLARFAPHSTVLVDLDVQFGDVASALNLAPEHTLLDVVRGPATQDSMVLKTFLTQHETGLHVVCGPDSPADADAITADDVAQLLTTLASEFRYVVVDTAPGLAEHALAAIDQTNDLVLVTSLDVPGVRGLRKELAVIRDLGLDFDGRHVVINMAYSHSGLTKSDVEATIGTGVDMVLPRTRGTAASVNQGVPLLQSQARDPMTTQLRKLVDRFTPAPMRAPRPDTEQSPGRISGRHRILRKRAER